MFWQKDRSAAPLSTLHEQLDLKLLEQTKPWKLASLRQFRYLSKILTGEEKKKFAVSLVLFIAATSLLIVRVWFHETIRVPKVGGVYTEGLIGSPRFINPLLALSNDVDRDLSSLVFSGLMKTDANGNVVRDITESYSISDDQKTYTIVLRDPVTWHDGEPLTADDVLYTIKTIQDPAYKSPYRANFTGVSADRIDKKTISFILKEPMPAFLSLLTVGIIPEHIWYSIPPLQAQLAEANIKPIGSGPYEFKMLTKDTSGSIRSITLSRFNDYFGEKPYIEELAFKFFQDFASALEAIKNKNIDGIAYIPLQYKDEIENFKNIDLKNLSLSHYTALFFNPEKNEILKDRKVRRALSLSIDRDRLIREALDGNGTAINGPLIPGFTGSVATSTPFRFDRDETAKLLDDAGWKMSATTSTRMNKDKELVITLTTADQQENIQASQIIQENWKSLGVKTDLNIVPRAKIRKEIIEPRNYQVLLFGQVIVSPQDVYAFWHSSQNKNPGNNLSLLANRDIDTMLETLRNTHNATQQNKLYQKLEDRLAEEVFAIFLYNPNYLYPISKKVHGTENIQRISFPSDRFATISQWYVETSRRPK